MHGHPTVISIYVSTSFSYTLFFSSLLLHGPASIDRQSVGGLVGSRKYPNLVRTVCRGGVGVW